MDLNYEALWNLAQEQGKRKAEAMWPPHMTSARLKAEYEYSLEFYRQMTHPVDLSGKRIKPQGGDTQMNEPAYCVAEAQPTTRAWRFRRFFVVRFRAACWIIHLLFLRLAYRHVMRLAHYFGWHYAPLKGPVEPNGDMYRWCQWCGLRGTVPNERRIIAELNGIPAASQPQEGK